MAVTVNTTVYGLMNKASIRKGGLTLLITVFLTILAIIATASSLHTSQHLNFRVTLNLNPRQSACLVSRELHAAPRYK